MIPFIIIKKEQVIILSKKQSNFYVTFNCNNQKGTSNNFVSEIFLIPMIPFVIIIKKEQVIILSKKHFNSYVTFYYK